MEVFLQKIVGGLSNAGGQIFDCSVLASQVTDPEEYRSLIVKAKSAKIETAFHIRAHEPSIEVYAFDKGEKFLLYRDYSQREMRSDPASAELIKRVNEKCPDPKTP